MTNQSKPRWYTWRRVAYFLLMPISLRLARRPALALGLAAVLAGTTGCRGAALAAGSDPASARANLDGLTTGFEYRFTNVTRSSKVQQSRLRMARYAFAPSKVVGDTSVWTGLRTNRSGAERRVEYQGRFVGNRYVFDAGSNLPVPSRLGDQRHDISLTQRASDHWTWHTAVEHHVGSMPPSRMEDMIKALFASAERPAQALRVDYRAASPRSMAVVGRMVRLDSIFTVPQNDGSTLVTLQMRVDSEGIRPWFPAYARFLAKYVEPSRYRYRLTDNTGAEWFDARAVNRVLTMRFRSLRGELLPINRSATGAPPRMPDTLTISVDALAKFGPWMVGVTDLHGQFVHIDTPRERAWAMRFTREPKWHLPLFAEKMLSSAIKSPFEGTGTYFKLGLRTGPDGQTLSERVLDTHVRESAIMRFLGNLGFTAMSDFAGQVEDEENRLFVELMQAMRRDGAAILGGGDAGP